MGDRIELSSTAEAMNFSRSPRTNLLSYALTIKKGGLCRVIHIVKKGLAMMGVILERQPTQPKSADPKDGDDDAIMVDHNPCY